MVKKTSFNHFTVLQLRHSFQMVFPGSEHVRNYVRLPLLAPGPKFCLTFVINYNCCLLLDPLSKLENSKRAEEMNESYPECLILDVITLETGSINPCQKRFSDHRVVVTTQIE